MLCEYEIREPQTIDEIEAISLLWCRTFRDLATHTDNELDRWFKVDEWKYDAVERLRGNAPDEFTLIAVVKERVVGAISGYRKKASDQIFNLEIMAVEKSARGNGIGTNLVKQLVHCCTDRHIKAIHFNTAELPEQGGAVAFWEKVQANAPVIEIGRSVYEDGEEGKNGVYYKIQLRGHTW